jgi:hypothetical protein
MAGEGPLKAQIRWLFHCKGCGSKWMVKHTLDNDPAIAGALNSPSKHCNDCNAKVTGELAGIRRR